MKTSNPTKNPVHEYCRKREKNPYKTPVRVSTHLAPPPFVSAPSSLANPSKTSSLVGDGALLFAVDGALDVGALEVVIFLAGCLT
jgi:hypothetical protein